MKKEIIQFFSLGIFIITSAQAKAQTTISAGAVSGNWIKASSPYLINGDVYVPKGQTLKIGNGVKIEFQGSYTLHVWGSIQATGQALDTVTFTAKNISTGWKGVYIHKNQTGADSNMFRYCKFEYANYAEYSLKTRGALGCDTVSNLSISNCRFYKNTSNNGSCIRGYGTNFNIQDCIFHHNLAIDNSTTVPAGWEPNGSAIASVFGNLIVKNCIFSNNSSYAGKDSRDTTIGMGMGVIHCFNASATFENTKFVNNYSSRGNTIRLGPLLSHNKTYIMKNCEFLNNTNGFDPLFQVDNGGQYTGIQTTIENCRFLGNTLTRGDFKPICINVYNKTGFGNKILLTNSLFYNNSAHKTRGLVVQMYHSVEATINACRFIGNRAMALNFARGGILRMDNSLFANNYMAYLGGEQISTSNVLVNNSAFVNNGVQPSDSAGFKGIYYFPVYSFALIGPDNLNVYNSIFWGNMGDNIKPANVFTENQKSGGLLKVFQNNYLQWGLASTSNNKGGTANISTYTNNFTDTLVFVKPSLGYGPGFADTSSDWHIINTCSNVPATYNKGTSAIKDGGGSPVNLPTKDLSGAKRVLLDTLDIGPYEIIGLKARTRLRTAPGNDSMCEGDKKWLKSEWDGLELTYTWEHSLDGISNWQSVQTADSSNAVVQPSVGGYYRVKAIQNECGRTNTSPAVLLKVKQLPVPLKSLTGDSVCPGNTIHLSGDWQGQQLLYTWEASSNGVSDWQSLQSADSSDIHFKPVSNKYYRLRVTTKGCLRDSLSNIVQAGVYPAPRPKLGNDTAIKQNKNLLLQPGSFTTYKWNTGDTTSTLLITGASEPLGSKTYHVTVSNQFGCNNSDTILVTIEKTIGLDDLSTSGFRIYPVPSKGNLTIERGDEEIFSYTLHDMQGKMITHGKHSEKLEIRELMPGSYIMTIQTQQNKRTFFISVQY